MKKVFRPDQSFFLAHFTTDRKPLGKDDAKNPAKPFEKLSAINRLVSILKGKRIIAATMQWSGRHAVCFSECPWTSLIEHTKRYSPYGIGFNKAFIFGAGGGPVYYVRKDHFDKQEFEPDIYTFVTPFWPEYRPKALNSKVKFDTCDFSHEREWRVPHDLVFEYHHIEFIVLNKYEDMAKFPRDLKDSIGRDKFLLMDNYKMVEKLWPVHLIGE
jgi:hypothetical protein